MYFLTEQDTDYQLKGSRDPLGFQVIWQHEGRKIFPFLSTVSNNLMDFQILVYGYALRDILGIQEEKEFVQFFIKFEQLMAYVRYHKNPKLGFGGITAVGKRYEHEKRLPIGMKNQILVNQKAYGIWGKYNRPFRESNFWNFDSIVHHKAKEKILSDKSFLNKCKSIYSKTESTYINKANLDKYTYLLDKPKGEELVDYRDILLVDTTSIGNGYELRSIFLENDVDFTNFYETLILCVQTCEDDKLAEDIAYITNLEHLLTILNHTFRYIQTQSYWKNEQISDNPHISQLRQYIYDNFSVHDFNKHVELYNILADNNLDYIHNLVSLNEAICKQRNNKSWMEWHHNYLEVNFSDGAMHPQDEKIAETADNTYFFGSFLSLFNQLYTHE